MRFGKMALAAVSAVALIGTPVAAQAASSAEKLATSKVKRAGVAKKAESQLGKTSPIILALGAAALIGAIILIADGSDSP